MNRSGNYQGIVKQDEVAEFDDTFAAHNERKNKSIPEWYLAIQIYSHADTNLYEIHHNDEEAHGYH